MSGKSAQDILDDQDFKSLASQKKTISTALTVVELALYFGFIALIAFNKSFLAGKISADRATTVGIPIAVGVIFLSWVLTGVYVWWANSSYDTLVRRVRDKIGA